MLQLEKTQADVSLALRKAKESLEEAEAAAKQTGLTFEESMSAIDAEMQLVQAEFEKSSQKLGEFGSASERLQLAADALTKQIELQKRKVSELAARYEEFIQNNDESSEAAIRLKTELVKEETVLASLENQLKATNAELRKSESHFEKLKSTMVGAVESSKKVGHCPGSNGCCFDCSWIEKH